MGKGRSFGSFSIIALVALAGWWNGCGTSNDQGISFRALGFFADGAGSVGDLGRCVSFTDDVQVPSPDSTGALSGAFLGLQNNLASEGIQLDHVDLSYSISGASIFIPSDVNARSTRLGPASGQEPAPTNAATHFLQTIIVSRNIFKFLNDNRSRLPQPPFEMVALATAVGTADSGEVFRTNRVTYQMHFVDGSCAAPTPIPTTTPAIPGGKGLP